jgi:DNA-binding transcriptional regulator PaaX
MVLTRGDLELLKQLRAAGGLGRNVRELNIRVTLDRLVKGGYLVGRTIDRYSVQYRITQQGQDAIGEHAPLPTAVDSPRDRRLPK